MAKIRLLVARDKAEAMALLSTVGTQWELIEDASGDFETLNYTRAHAAIGAPDSFSVTDADGSLHVMVLRRD